MFNNPARKASSHYGIRDNDVLQFVKETDTAWTNSNWAANCRAVTIEVVNDVNADPWSVSAESYDTLIALVYDIAKRNNLLPLVKGVSLTWHSMYAATACPGAYLFARLDNLVTQVNALYSANDGDYTPQPTPNTMYRVRATWEDATSQQGAYTVLANAKAHADRLNANPRYTVYDNDGNAIYPE